MSASSPASTAVQTVSWQGPDVCICGVGARTPLGLDAASSAAAVRAGISAVTVHPAFLDRADEPMAFASDALLDECAPLPERMGRMLAGALAGLPMDRGDVDRLRAGCWLGLPEPRTGIVVSDLVDACSEPLQAAGWPAPQLLARGHAAGLMALQLAAQRISEGAVDLALVAAVDSYQDPETLHRLDRSGWLMSAGNRNGFPPGEAAGACVLASRGVAHRLGLPVLGRVVAASTATEPLPIRSTQGVCIGVGLTAVLRSVIATLAQPTGAITATYCDLNGQRYRNEEFVYAMLRTQEAFVDAHDYLCPADCWGDVGAACGPLFVALAVAATQRGYAKGPRPLLWAGSESGYRSAVLLDLSPA